MAVNKVEYGDTVLLDLTGDTVSADTLLKGASAHNASGEVIDGAVDLNNYYTKDETAGYVNQEIGKLDFSNFATKADIPDTSGLATETYVSSSIAAAQPDLSGYAKTSDIPDVSGLATSKYVDDEVAEVVKVAAGKTASYVFETVGELDAWLGDSANTAKLNKGDVFLIKAVNVPDYWWDGSGKSILETTKVDLAPYAKTEEIPGIKVYDAYNADHAVYAEDADTCSGYAIKVRSRAPTDADDNTITLVI